MKITYYISITLFLLLNSCTTVDTNGETSITLVGWLCIFFGLFFIITIVNSNKESKESKQKLKKEGLDYTCFHPIGNYVGGHPKINDNLENIYFRKVENEVVLYKIPIYQVSMPEEIVNAPIQIDKIENITVEDATSIENRITLGRVFLVGVFALAWKKKKKNELAFVVIDWKKGKFDNATTFSFEGKDAMQRANTARNKLISICDD